MDILDKYAVVTSATAVTGYRVKHIVGETTVNYLVAGAKSCTTLTNKSKYDVVRMFNTKKEAVDWVKENKRV